MNLLLTRHLAILQARVNVLNDCSDVFTELSDMKEFRKLKGEVEEFIQTQHQKNGLPPNPSEWALWEIDQVEKALEAADSLYRQSSAVGNLFLKAETFPMDISAFDASVALFEKQLSQLPEKLMSANSLFQENQWEDGGDVKAELLAFAQLAWPKSKFHTFDRKGLHAFVHEAGPLWKKVENQILMVRATIEELRQEYDKAKPQWKLAADCASKGDYLQAENILTYLPNRLVDGDYRSVRDKIEEWKKAAESYKKTDLDSQLSDRMSKPLPLNPFMLARRRDERLATINSLDAWADEELSKISGYDECDFKQTAEKTLDARKQQLVLARGEVVTQMRRRLLQISGILALTVLVLSLIAYSILRYNTVLSVDSSPQGATVELDGQQVGSTPLELRWASPGTRRITFRLADYLDKNLSILAQLNRRTALEAKLERDPVVVARELVEQKEKEATKAAEAEQVRREKEAEVVRQQQAEQERRDEEVRASLREERRQMYAKAATPGNVYNYNYTPPDGKYPRQVRIEFANATRDDGFYAIGTEVKLIARVTETFGDGTSHTDACSPQLADYDGHGLVLLLDKSGYSGAFSESGLRISEHGVNDAGWRGDYILEYRDGYIYLIDEK